MHRARDLQRSRKVLEEYITDVKKRTYTISTGVATLDDHKASYKSLPRAYGVEQEKSIEDSTQIRLSDSLVKSVIRQVKKEKKKKAQELKGVLSNKFERKEDSPSLDDFIKLNDEHSDMPRMGEQHERRDSEEKGHSSLVKFEIRQDKSRNNQQN